MVKGFGKLLGVREQAPKSAEDDQLQAEMIRASEEALARLEARGLLEAYQASQERVRQRLREAESQAA